MDMRALYYIALPLEREKNEDAQNHESDIKANENCLNQNFALLADKIYEFEARLAQLETTAEAWASGLRSDTESGVKA